MGSYELVHKAAHILSEEIDTADFCWPIIKVDKADPNFLEFEI